MRVALIDVVEIFNKEDRENLGLCSIATYLRYKGITVELFSFIKGEKYNYYEMFDGKKFDIYGFNIFSCTAEDVLKRIRIIKEANPNVLTYLGGRLASDAYKYIFVECPDLDFVVLGYGEEPLYRQINAIMNGHAEYKDPNIAYNKPVSHDAIINHDATPSLTIIPDRDLLACARKMGNITARLNTTVGCFGNCSFCSLNSFVNKTDTKRCWRGRSAAHIFKEIKALHEEMGMSSFIFNDASFEDDDCPNHKRINELLELLEGYKERMAFRCSFRAESFSYKDKDLLMRMKNNGFCNIFIGLESANNEDLAIFHKRASKQKNIAAINLYRECGIDLTYGFIMLNTFSTMSTIEDNLQFLFKLYSYRPDLYFHRTEIYYNTTLCKELQQKGLLKEGFNYKTPYAFGYVDPDVAKLDTTLDLVRNNKKIAELSGRLLLLDYLFSILKVFNEEEANRYYNRILDIRDASFDICHRLFSEMIHLSREKLLTNMLNTDKDIDKVLSMIFNINFSFIKNLKFRDYFFTK